MIWYRTRALGATAVCAGVIAAIAACGGSSHAGSASSAPVATSVAPGSPLPAGSGSGGAAPPRSTPGTRQATPPGSAATPTGPAPTPGTCLFGAVRIVYPGSDNPLRSVCVHAGSQITVTLNAVHSYKWAPIKSSDSAVVLMTGNHAAEGGTLVEVARAESPGTATLSSADTFTPDPHGPPSRLWQLSVTVVP
ncbi:hypothetical protein ABIA32_000475 [Streptacidiphilus sp. MAP12-20]|uniref:hypothetical protein n=1 Tax=Streptacidiphilus sp. MAP12-20 TaxID=3156299 RepID=UPI003517725F